MNTIVKHTFDNTFSKAYSSEKKYQRWLIYIFLVTVVIVSL